MRTLFKQTLLAIAVASLLTSVNGPALAGSLTIVINEVDCRGNDWVELFNPTASTVDISGWALSDKAPILASGPHLYQFPENTKIPARGYLVVEQSGVGAQQLTFGVPCSGGQSVYLSKAVTASSFTVIGQVLVRALPAGASYGRLPNASGNFAFTHPTKGQSNISALPRYLGASTFACQVKKKCSFQLKATNAAVFQLVKPVSGLGLSISGVLTIKKLRTGKSIVDIKMMNPSGVKVVKLHVNVR